MPKSAKTASSVPMRLLPKIYQIPDNSIVMGSPAKVVKTLPQAREVMLQQSALHYVDKAHAFKAGLKPIAIEY